MLRSLSVLALVLAPLAARAADEENPYKKAKVGDFAKYTMTVKTGPGSQEVTRTQTVKEVSDKEVTLKTTLAVAGRDTAGPDMKIDLTKPLDPLALLGNVPGGNNLKLEKLKDGKEKVKVDGKEYDCTWTTYKPDFGAKAVVAIDGEIKVWTCKEIPGAVKTSFVMKIQANEISIEAVLTEFGNKK